MQKSRGFEWSYRDLLTALVVVYMAMAALALIASTKASSETVPPGNVMFQLTWDQAKEADVDLWVEAPGDAPVGYSHPAGRHCNLLRDDLGRPTDPESRNTELTVCRGTPDGEWIANAALYADRDGKLPLSATIAAFVADGSGTHRIAQRTVMLSHEGEEETAFRFTLSHGRLVAGSINHLPMKLWNVGS
ncbi:MAG TPA: hypothetical protein VMA86_07810 [Acetobacteraceae bacterium]|nr:hypothetical protein [Acetobacteraceae bacterium]